MDLSVRLFQIAKQVIGDFRGEEDSQATIRDLMQMKDLSTQVGVIDFVESLERKLNAASRESTEEAYGLTGVLRIRRTSQELYDLLFGLSYLEPKYTLRFQETAIEQLSPGQRGALLLIFYLLVDAGRRPIILDQPEENLDNETVVNLLVPVLREAKRRRQILMVTHNPNLAVVCDADQIVHCKFDRTAACSISYEAGGIESPNQNLYAVNVLEGTKPAFHNREGKYH